MMSLLIAGVLSFGTETSGTLFLHLQAPRPLHNITVTVLTSGPIQVPTPPPRSLWRPGEALAFPIVWEGAGGATVEVRILQNGREVARKVWDLHREAPVSVHYAAPFLVITGGTGSATVEVFNALGRRVLERRVVLGERVRLPFRAVPGVYPWQIRQAESRRQGRWVLLR